MVSRLAIELHIIKLKLPPHLFPILQNYDIHFDKKISMIIDSLLSINLRSVSI